MGRRKKRREIVRADINCGLEFERDRRGRRTHNVCLLFSEEGMKNKHRRAAEKDDFRGEKEGQDDDLGLCLGELLTLEDEKNH